MSMFCIPATSAYYNCDYYFEDLYHSVALSFNYLWHLSQLR